MKELKFVVPRRLSAAARAWVEAVISKYHLETHHYRFLLQAADFWDEAEQATVILRREGVTVLSAAGTTKVHPALAVARSSRLGFAAMCKALGLDDDETPSGVPGSRSHHAGKGYYT